MKQFHPTFITLTFCLATSWLQAMDESISTPQLRAKVNHHTDTPAVIETALSGLLSAETLRAILSVVKEEDSRRKSTSSTPSNVSSSAISAIKGNHRHTLLDDSSEREERELAQELIEPEAHNNETEIISEAEKEKRRWTDLHVAAWKGDLETAAALVLQQAHLEAQSNTLDTPLHLATWKKHTHLAMLLIGCGASFLNGNYKWATPFHHAAYSGDAKVVELMLSYNPPLDGITKTGNTPLHCAAWHNHVEVARLLLAHGAPVTANAKGDTLPFH